MATDPKKLTASWLVITVLFGALFGAASYHFLDPKEPCPPCPDPPGVKWVSCFDAKNLEDMTLAPEARGARFYMAKGIDGGFAVLAAPIREDGSHTPDVSGELRFRLFKAMVDASADVALLEEADAERAVKEVATSGGAPWSIDVKSDLLSGLLATHGANGVGIAERRTSDGTRTFELAPVRIASGAATAVGTVDDILVGSGPCPLHCPRDPSMYLHMRR